MSEPNTDGQSQPQRPLVVTIRAADARRPPILVGDAIPNAMGWLIGGAILFNLISSPLGGIGGGLLGVIFLGIHTAQLGLASLWLVFGQGPFHRRLANHGAVVFVLYVAWALGFVIANGSVTPPGTEPPVWEGVVLCSLPIVSLSAQLPLWPLRIYFGWHILRPDSQPAEPAQPLSIANFIAGTVVTSVSLAALRLLPELMPEDIRGGPDFWMGWGIGMASVVSISAASLLPALHFLLRGRESAPAIARWLGYVAMLVAIVTAAFATLAAPHMAGYYIVIIAVIFAPTFFTFAVSIGISLLILRAGGYRLAIKGDKIAAVH